MESVLRRGEIPSLPAVIPEELLILRTGVYIAAYEKPGRKPHGCVGSVLPTKPTLAEDIVAQTIRLVETFRFRKEDLPHLTLELILTHPAALLADLASLPPNAGLLVRTSRGKVGVSLRGHQGPSAGERFREACAQGDIDPRTDDVRLYVFAVETFAERAHAA